MGQRGVALVPRDSFVESGHIRAMKGIWATALAALQQAKELIVIDYSLPGTDAASIEALKHFAASSTAASSKRIRLIEQYFSALAEQYRTIFGIVPTLAFSDFAQFDPSAP